MIPNRESISELGLCGRWPHSLPYFSTVVTTFSASRTMRIDVFDSIYINASMRLSTLAAVSSLLVSSLCSAESNLTTPQSSQVLHGDFKPPQVFKNVNLVRNTNLDKGYVRETINVVIENIDKEPQSVYYLPFENDLIAKVGGLEVRDKKNTEKGRFDTQTAAMSAVLGDDRTTTT